MMIENNKIIAEFMEVLFDKEDNLYYINATNTLEFGRWVKEVPYNIDYNLLMEVLNKIQRLGYWIKTQSTNNGVHASFFIGKTGFSDPIIQYSRGKVKETYYKACLEFIKWYNEQKGV